MNMMSRESVAKALGREVSEIHLLIAKNHVLGLEADQIARLLGVGASEVQELLESLEYKEVRAVIGAEYAALTGAKDLSWDSIEAKALENLSKRVQFTQDTDVLLKIAAVANKAIRRQSASEVATLEPTAGARRVPITLTRRFVEKLTSPSGAVEERTETQQISVMNGSAVNPNFQDIDSLLGVNQRPRIAENVKIRSRSVQVDAEDLLRDLTSDE